MLQDDVFFCSLVSLNFYFVTLLVANSGGPNQSFCWAATRNVRFLFNIT